MAQRDIFNALAKRKKNPCNVFYDPIAEEWYLVPLRKAVDERNITRD